MNLGADVFAFLPIARAQAESRMTETFDFYYVTSNVIPDGEIDPQDVETPVHSDIPGRLRFPSLNVSDRESAGQMVGVQDVTVSVAVGATPNVREGHFCRVTASEADVSLVGRVFRVSGSPQAGSVTAHRYPLQEE